MRIVLVLIAVGLLLIESGGVARPGWAHVSAANIATVSRETTRVEDRVDFDSQIKPIFKAKCMPCHFSGGQMYDKLPLDKPETIRKLGVKVFTRIKDDESRKLIEAFLHQQP